MRRGLNKKKKFKESDGLILVENDEAQIACTKLLNLKRPSLENMNEVISKQLASVFFPVILFYILRFLLKVYRLSIPKIRKKSCQ